MVEWIEHPALKWALPFPLIAALAPLIWLFFRRTWRELDEEAFVHRRTLHERGEIDYRPVLALVLGSLVLTFQEYYGRYSLWNEHLRKWLLGVFSGHSGVTNTIELYDELFGRGWWGLTRVLGYLFPLMIWPLFFRKDSLLDMGLRTRGFREHAWLYALFVTVMIPVMLIVARQPDFGSYYPIYDQAGRSWVDFLIWEFIYLAQFLGLEIFFRGWWLRATRAFGIGAIFSMVVPYCMIHYGKPYLEADAAIIAGTVLGSLSMKTRNIWSGFLVHGTVGLLMDILALGRKGQLPTRVSPQSTRHLIFPYWDHLLWAIWFGSLVVLGWTAWRRRAELRAMLASLRRRSS